MAPPDTAHGKIKSAAEIGKIASHLHKEKRIIATTNGVFDILHLGHITYLEKARNLGDVLIVGINSDSSVRSIKGPKRPINNERERAACVAALSCVDYVVIFDEKDPIRLLSEIKPHVHVKGGDYLGHEGKIVEKEIVEKNGGKIALVDVVEGYSTSALIERITDAYGKGNS